jgi:hypothetical protein
VKGRATAVITGCLICAIVPAVLAIVEGIYHDVPATLVWLGVIIGFLPGGMGAFTERWHEKIQKKIEKKIQFGKVAVASKIGCKWTTGVGSLQDRQVFEGRTHARACPSIAH